MIIVYTPGVFDLLHVGHLHYLESASAFGDILVVGIPSDHVVKEDKGTKPVIPLEDRLSMVRAIKWVSAAIPYHKLEFRSHLCMVNPDILVIGEQWGTDERHRQAEDWVRDNDRRIIRLPYYRGESTTSIINRIRSKSDDRRRVLVENGCPGDKATG